MGLFDVHAHLTHPRLADRADLLIENARAAGLTTIISNGLNPHDNEAVRRLAAEHSIVKPAFGLYPVDAVIDEMQALGVDYPRDSPHFTVDEAVRWLEAHLDEAFAVGEIGLDGYWVPESLWPAQEEAFRRFVTLALAADKPIIIHTRKRERRTLEILEEMGVTRVNWHCFGGRVKLARAIAEHGHYLSIPANAKRSQSFTRMLETLPPERVLLETDSPYLGPVPGEDNEPANVRHTLEHAAAIWGISEADAERRLAENFEALFRVAP